MHVIKNKDILCSNNMIKWYISIPDPDTLHVVNVTNGLWYKFWRKFPSIITNDYTRQDDYIICDSIYKAPPEAFEYAIPNGYRYGVYKAEGNRLVYLKPYAWSYTPCIDYRGRPPYMLVCA